MMIKAIFLPMLYLGRIIAWELNICLLHQKSDLYPEYNLTESLYSIVKSVCSNDRYAEIALNASLIEITNYDFTDLPGNGCSRIPQECHGLITIADCPRSSLVNIWASKHMIPHVILNHKSCDQLLDYGVKLMPSFGYENKVIVAIASFAEWSDVLILHDESLDSRQKHDLVHQLSRNHISSLTVDIKRSEYLLIERSNLLEYQNTVVFAHEDNIIDIFRNANNISMLGEDVFVLVSSDSLILDSLPTDINMVDANILLLKRATSSMGRLGNEQNVCSSKENVQPIVEGVEDAFELLTTAAIHSSLPEKASAPYNICSSEQDDVILRSNVSNSLLLATYGAKIKRFDEYGYPSDVRYDICSRTQEGLVYSGHWTQVSGLSLTNPDFYQHKFRDFGNKMLTVGALMARPFNIKKIVGNEIVWEGFCMDILNELSTRLKFRYTIVEPADGVWGSPIGNDSWNGIVGEIVSGNFDLGVGPFTITAHRDTVIDFTKPYTDERVGIITLRPDSDSKKMFKMFSPLLPEVWACIGALFPVIALVLYIVNRQSPFSSQNSNSKNIPFTLKESFWVVYGSYVEQGSTFNPRSISGRLILGFWWLFTILMASTYTANLAAFLTVSVAEKPINSLRELSQQTEIMPLVKFGSNLYTLFKEADSGIYKEIWNMMENMPKVKSNDEGLEVVKSQNAAFMTDRSQLEYELLNDCGTYSIADESFNSAVTGFVMPENAEFSDAINQQILKMQEGGLIRKWKQKWWPSSDQCSGADRTSQAKTLDLKNLAGPIVIFLAIALNAAIILVIEIVIRSKSAANLARHFSSKREEAEISLQD